MRLYEVRHAKRYDYHMLFVSLINEKFLSSELLSKYKNPILRTSVNDANKYTR